ncbi:MAG: hypothetical protein AB2693_16175 [Candidatus Thiodiazotropha sp.]
MEKVQRDNIFFESRYTMITTYNTAVADAASEILGKECSRKKPWINRVILDLCNERKDLKLKELKSLGKLTRHSEGYIPIFYRPSGK